MNNKLLENKILDAINNGIQEALIEAELYSPWNDTSWKERSYGEFDDYDRCKEEASHYLSKSEFAKGSPSAYQSTRAHGWIDDFFQKGKQHRWTYEEIKHLLDQCNDNPRLLQRINSNAYMAYRKMIKKNPDAFKEINN